MGHRELKGGGGGRVALRVEFLHGLLLNQSSVLFWEGLNAGASAPGLALVSSFASFPRLLCSK